MFSNQQYRKGLAVLVAVMLTVTQVGFLLVHHHDEVHIDNQEIVIDVAGDWNTQVVQDCALCEHFFGLSADIHHNSFTLLSLVPGTQLTAYAEQCSQAAYSFESSRAPPVLV